MVHRSSARRISHSRMTAFFGTVLILGIVSCYPGTIEDLDEFDTVSTLYDAEEDFAANQTYSMPDTVIHLCDLIDADADCLPVSRAFDQDILDELADQMEALGYTRVAHDPDNLENADLVLIPAAIAVENVAAWVDYWPCYYPYYCYYPPTWTVVEYQVGTLLLQMVDPARVTQTRLATVWAAGVRGVLESSTSNRTRVLDGIRQAFAQSPYLNVEGN